MASIAPVDDFAEVEFISSDTSVVTVSPEKARFSDQMLEIKGVGLGKADIVARYNGKVIGKMSVVSYDLIERDIALVLIHEKNYKSTGLAVRTIQAFCDEVYRHAVVKLNIVSKPEKTIAFDLNADKKIDVSSPWPGPELQKIIDNASHLGYDFNIFLVDNPDDGSLGWSNFSNSEKTAVAHMNAPGMRDPASTLEKTIIHEIGHGLFGLPHPVSDEDISDHLKQDPENNMTQGSGLHLNKLRYYQWERLR